MRRARSSGPALRRPRPRGDAGPPRDVSWNVMRCHDPHAEGSYPAAVSGMRSSLESPSFACEGALFQPGLSLLRGGRPVLPRLCLSASCMSFRHPVLFSSVPFSPPVVSRRGGTLIRALCARAPAPAGARFAAARFARLIAPAHPCARTERRAHVSCPLLRGLLAPARTEAASGYRFRPTHIGMNVPGCKPNFGIISDFTNKQSRQCLTGG